MESRRTLLKTLALGAAVAAVPVSSVVSKAQAASRPSAPAEGPAPWWLLAPLKPGDPVGNGWSIGTLSAVERGAAVLELHRGLARVRVHLCVHEGTPKGLVHTALLDLILMDGGDGDRPTDEGLGRVLHTVAKRIRANEVDRNGDLRPISRMLTHEERVEAFGPENLG